MHFLGPTRHHRLNEAAGIVYLAAATVLFLALFSFHADDPSFNTATSAIRAQNLIGRAGSHTADLLFQLLGLAAWLLPAGLTVVAFRWLFSRPIRMPVVRMVGFGVLLSGTCAILALLPVWPSVAGVLPPGGLAGVVLADALVTVLNPTGALILTLTCMVLSLYLLSSFSLAMVPLLVTAPAKWTARQRSRWESWREERALRRAEKQRVKDEQLRQRAAARAAREEHVAEARHGAASHRDERPRQITAPRAQQAADDDLPPWEDPGARQQIPVSRLDRMAQEAAEHPASDAEPQPEREIPIFVLEELEPPALPQAPVAPEPTAASNPPAFAFSKTPRPRRPLSYSMPPTAMLNEAPARQGYDGVELKETASRIKAKFEEFNVLGSVVQINPGPVVTTFEYKPEAGIKYSRIISLNEDLCLGLQAESIFVERLAGKNTVGIEVPNSRREVISLRQILESEEFQESPSKLTICLGKDINGRIKVAPLESMPHLLIAGSTGSGKSVMLNSLIMSVLYKATPEDVRMILVDPKRVEMGIYEGIPHLLTPVITDAKQATNALRNAVHEMERRLKLLASQGVRNIEQFNRKVRQMQEMPRSLFDEDGDRALDNEELKPLPFILLVIDELADLMMLERANVEASVTRLAQMARAVGMHLVLATQRPSVDVITGLIKANFPSRISFRVATRVDSRTVLDCMGAEHLLGKGDMLYLPPGSSRLTRVHGAFVTENEINRVVEHWRDQALPDYDQSFLMAPPSEDGEDTEITDGEDGAPSREDPMYQEAVRVVLEMGKASTSILQRRLRLGYGRAARILDMMHKDGIIGPVDGSRPREVLKRPDWLDEVDKD
jgi:DNA segregation ATPase FtsK/SpoIIIE, S-DNA-T family